MAASATFSARIFSTLFSSPSTRGRLTALGAGAEVARRRALDGGLAGVQRGRTLHRGAGRLELDDRVAEAQNVAVTQPAFALDALAVEVAPVARPAVDHHPAVLRSSQFGVAARDL